jgi:hypothetical protein
VGSVVHQQQLKVLDVVDEESLVAGGGQETGLLVGAVADLNNSSHISALLLVIFSSRQSSTYLGHTDGTAETSADTAIDTLGLSPAGTDTIEPVTLVTVERSLVCTSPVNYASNMLVPALRIKRGSNSVAFSHLP